MSMFAESLRAFLKPVVPFLDDPLVSEILINGFDEIWIEKKGKLYKTEARFSEEGLLAAARNMAQYVGRPLSDERPRLDARLPDGSRIHVVLPPVSRKGCTLAIRKFFPDRLGLDTLIKFGTITKPLARFLEALIELRLNIVVAGGTGSGKTSLLNVLSSVIAPHERILTIEDSAELQLQQPHLVSLETRPPDKLGKGEVTIGDLLQSALRLRPDRIIVGEVRGGECFYLLQAMNTGHGGSLTTTHANTPVDTLRRLESLCLLSGVDLPLRAVRAQVAGAVHLVVCCERLADGSRKVTTVAEALPLDERGEYRVQDLFVYEQTGRTADGLIEGHHVPTGLLPSFFKKFAAHGINDIDAAFFDPAAQGLSPPTSFVADLGARSVWAKDWKDAAPKSAAVPAPARVEAAPGPVAAPVPAAEASKPAEPAVAAAPASAATAATAPIAIAAPASAPAPTAAAAAPQADTDAEDTDETDDGEDAATDAGEEASLADDDDESTSNDLAPAAAAPAPIVPPTVPSLPAVQTPKPPAARPASAAAAPAASSGVRAPGAVRRTAITPAAQKTPVPTPVPERAEAKAPERPAPKKQPVDDGPSIQLDPELAAEVEAALPYESTLITRNPLLDTRTHDDDATNPGARNPMKR
ncbi:MAG: CpaF family protein [Deltaproteobacteria bacterium]|nr:CpaF family protein [Deltaproteobacteria bacterium]